MPGALDFERSEKGKFCSKNTDNVIKAFIALSESIDDAISKRNECEDFCRNNEECWGCSVHCDQPNPCQWNAIPDCGDPETHSTFSGMIEGDITRKKNIGNLFDRPI